MPLVATEAMASATPAQTNGDHGHNGVHSEGNKGSSEGGKKPTLDLFWKLGQAKNEKQRLEAAMQVLSNLASKALPQDYALGRLVRGLAASSADTRQGFFICLTEFLRQSDTKYADVANVMSSSLRIAAGTASKSEEADFLLGRLLTITAVLRADKVPDTDREDVLSELLTIAKARNYLLLPVFRLLVEHFVPLGGEPLLVILKSFNLEKMDIDILYLLLSLIGKDEELVSAKVIELLGVKEIWGKRALTIYSRVLSSANAPPSVVARHPLLPLLVATLVKKGALQKFWQALSSDMTVANNSGLTGWIFLREVGRNGAGQLPALMSRHALSVGLQLAGRQASASLPKEVLAILVKGVEAGEVERAQIIKMLLAQDINWDKTALGGQVGELMGKADAETVREVGGLFLKCLQGEGKLPERTHSASQLVKLVGHPAVQGDLAWRGSALQGLASVSLLQGVQDVAKMNRQGWEGLRDCLTRGLDSRNRTLEDSISLTLDLVTWIREQLEKPSVSLLKAVTPEQEAMGSSTMDVVQELEKQWARKEKDKEAGVLLLLYSHMWLQIFLQPDLAVEVLEELKPVYSRWKSRQLSSEEEPDWVEVVTEILLSILASNSSLMRSVVGSVFSVISPQMNEAAMLSLLNVVRKKSQGDDDEEDEDDEDVSGDEEDEDEEEADNDGSDKEDPSSDSDDDDDDDDELEEGLGDAVEVSDDLKKKLGAALGKHKEESDAEDEDDLDMDDIPEEDMKELDKKLAEAFKAIGGRKDRLTKKKEAMAALAEMHFKLRALDLVELYLTNKPQPALLCLLVPALLDALDRAVRADANSVLVSRLVVVLGKCANLPGKLSKEELVEVGEQLVAAVKELFSRAGSGSVLVATLGKTYSRLATALLRLGELGGSKEEMEKVYLQALDDFLHNKTCVLPPETFGLAMAHNWQGCWAIASQLVKEALKPSLRQFRRVSVLNLLSNVLGNKRLIAEAPTQATALEVDLLPSLAGELVRLVEGDLVRKLKPKYIQEVLSLLLHLKTRLPEDKKSFDSSFEKLMTSLAGAWPEGKHWNEAKKLLNRLAAKFPLTLVFTIRKKDGEVAMSASSETPSKKKGKKRKKKNQEQLKKAKEMKMELAAAQVDTGVPSFSEFVTDNTEVVEEEAQRKRKGLEDGTSSRDKKHKKKKLKKGAKQEN